MVLVWEKCKPRENQKGNGAKRACFDFQCVFPFYGEKHQGQPLTMASTGQRLLSQGSTLEEEKSNVVNDIVFPTKSTLSGWMWGVHPPSCLSADVPALVLASVPQKQPHSEAEVKPWPRPGAARSPPHPGLQHNTAAGT